MSFAFDTKIDWIFRRKITTYPSRALCVKSRLWLNSNENSRINNRSKLCSEIYNSFQKRKRSIARKIQSSFYKIFMWSLVVEIVFFESCSRWYLLVAWYSGKSSQKVNQKVFPSLLGRYVTGLLGACPEWFDSVCIGECWGNSLYKPMTKYNNCGTWLKLTQVPRMRAAIKLGTNGHVGSGHYPSSLQNIILNLTLRLRYFFSTKDVSWSCQVPVRRALP